MRKRLAAVGLAGVVAIVISASPARAQISPPPANCEETCCLCEYVEYPCEWDDVLQAWVCPWEFGCGTGYYEEGYEDCEMWIDEEWMRCRVLGDMCADELLFFPDEVIDGVLGLELLSRCPANQPMTNRTEETASGWEETTGTEGAFAVDEGFRFQYSR